MTLIQSPDKETAEMDHNKSNLSPSLVQDETLSESKTNLTDVYSDPMERFIGKIHTNLDNRYSITGVLAMEMRKPVGSGLYRTSQQQQQQQQQQQLYGTRLSMGSTVSASPISQVERRDEWCHPVVPDAPKPTEEKEKNEFVLTAADQIELAQKFCTHFYQRYCTAAGDLHDNQIQQQQPHNWSMETPMMDPYPVELHQQGPVGEKASIRMDQTDSESKASLCPFFFVGSLSDAAKMSERSSGRPWPVIIFYLHHEDSIHTRGFVQDVLCSEIVDSLPMGSPYIYKLPMLPPLLYDATTPSNPSEHGLIDTPSHSTHRPRRRLSRSQPPSIMTTRCSSNHPPPDAVTELPPPDKSNHRKKHQSSGKNGQFGSRLFRATSSSTNRRPESQTSSVKQYGRRSSIGLRSERKKVKQAKAPSEDVDLTTSRETNNAAHSFLFPTQDAEEPLEGATTSRLVTTHSDSGLVYYHSGDVTEEEISQTYANAYQTKTFRALLLERSAGLIPWDCTDERMRIFLASAFRGTQLVDWLEEWTKPNQYPILVALGRTADREVICSRLLVSDTSRLNALRWLNDVTLAHFNNFRRANNPVCPEKGERRVNTPSRTSSRKGSKSHVDSRTVPMPSITPASTIIHAGTTVSGGCTTAMTGELTEHMFTYLVGARTNNVGTMNLQMPNPKSKSTQEIIYHITKTPLVQDGPISFLFETTSTKRSDKFTEQLRRVQSSFRQATSALAKSTTLFALKSLGIPLNSASGEWAKTVPVTALLATLCDSPPELPMPYVHCNTSEQPPQVVPSTSLRLSQKTSNTQYDGVSDENVGHGSGHTRVKEFGAIMKHVSIPVNLWPSALSSSAAFSDFYSNFRHQFVMEFPTTVPFLLGRLHTAMTRTMNVMAGEQVSPLLIYLHDSRAPGVSHFVANVLCSRRFTSKLFDIGLHIWPLDVSGVTDLANDSLRSRTSDSHSKDQSQVNPDVPGGSGSRRRRLRSWSLKSKSPHKQAHANKATVEQLKQQQTSSTTKKGTGRDAQRRPSTNDTTSKGCLAGEQLLEYFQGHPAEQTVSRIFKIPILPTLINVCYVKKTFSVTHVLLPSSTTKESLIWLNTVLKLFQRMQTIREAT